MVLGRLIEPASKLETLRVLEEIGVRPCGYATVKRRLAGYAEPAWRQQIASACAAHVGLGPATLVLYDVSTLYFERLMPGTGSGNPDTANNAAWNPRSPSGC